MKPIIRNELDQYVIDNLSELIQLIQEISEIPSPTGKEEAKAQFIMAKLKQYGAQHVTLDEVGKS